MLARHICLVGDRHTIILSICASITSGYLCIVLAYRRPGFGWTLWTWAWM